MAGKRNGEGRTIWANGNLYEGQYKDDMQHGIGKMEFFDKRQPAEEGRWTNDVFDDS